MDHALTIVAFLFLAQRDPQDALAAARARWNAAAPHNTCTETIERSYYHPAFSLQSNPSCERILIDRKKGRAKAKLDATDRVRLSVSVVNAHEIYSWIEPGPFSGDAYSLIHTGPISTGAFGTYLTEIFRNPATRFEFTGENGKNLEYHYRVPLEASRQLIGAGESWRAAGYDGSLIIDASTLDVVRLTLETGELPRDTSMCEVRATVDFQNLAPVRAESHNVMRDSSSTANVTTFSNCAASPPPRVDDKTPPVLPPGTPLLIELSESIDSATAAAGDPISGTLTKSIPHLAPAGSRVTGRILRLEHQFGLEAGFALELAFDTLEIDGVKSPLHARLEQKAIFVLSRRSQHTFPAGLETKWRTISK